MVDLLVNDFNRTLSEFSLVVEVCSRANRMSLEQATSAGLGYRDA
jgi:hypothetical protein